MPDDRWDEFYRLHYNLTDSLSTLQMQRLYDNRPKCWLCSQREGHEVRVEEVTTQTDLAGYQTYISVRCHGAVETIKVPDIEIVLAENPNDIDFGGWAFKPTLEAPKLPLQKAT